MFGHKYIPLCFVKNVIRIGKQRAMNLDLCCMHLKQVLEKVLEKGIIQRALGGVWKETVTLAVLTQRQGELNSQHLGRSRWVCGQEASLFWMRVSVTEAVGEGGEHHLETSNSLERLENRWIKAKKK